MYIKVKKRYVNYKLNHRIPVSAKVKGKSNVRNKLIIFNIYI